MSGEKVMREPVIKALSFGQNLTKKNGTNMTGYIFKAIAMPRERKPRINLFWVSK